MHATFLSRAHNILVFFSCLFISITLYSNTISAEFVYDDFFFVPRQELRDPSYLLQVWKDPFHPDNPTSGVWRPLTTFSFALNFIFFGEKPISFHLTNILLNGVATFLVYTFTKKLTKNTTLAYFSSLIFAFLPIHTSAVAFIKSRDEILYTILALSSWIFFLKTRESTHNFKKNLWISGGLFFLATLTKEQAIFIPFFFFGLDILQRGFKPTISSIRSLLVTIVPYITISILYLSLRFLILKEYAFGKSDVYFTSNPLQDAEFWTHIFTAFTIAFIYISKTFIPLNLSATYTYNHLPYVSNLFLSWESLAGLTLLSLCIGIIFFKKTKNTPLWYGTTIFLLCYFPFSRFIFKDSGEIVEEHWMYLPSLGLSLIFGHILFRIYQFKKKIAVISLLVILSIYGATTIVRNRVWRNEKTLYTSMIESAPHSISGHLFMADWYFRNKLYNNAQIEALKAFDIYPDHPRVLNLLGKLEMASGNFRQAEQFFIRSIALKPTLPESHKLYVRALSKQGRHEESVTRLVSYLKIAPLDPELRYLMAFNLYKLGRLEEATNYFDWRQDISYEEKIKLLEKF